MPGSEVDLKANPQNSLKKIRLIVVGRQASKAISAGDGFGEDAEIVQFFEGLEDWQKGNGEIAADLIVAECPTLFPESIEFIKGRVESSGAVRAVVIYHFCPSGTAGLMDKRNSGITALRAPVTPSALKQASEADLVLATIKNFQSDEEVEIPDFIQNISEEAIPERQFSDEQIADFSQISTTIECECPRHMASLLSALNAFEKYSAECENKSEGDAILHSFLHRRTANARSILEDALGVLAEAEGIDI